VRGIDRRTGIDTVRRALTMTIGLLHWSEQPERVEAVMNPEPTANEADLLEQQLDVLPAEDDDFRPIDQDVEADPADVQEQQRPVPAEDEEEDR
jgi:acyl-CoA thioesterase